MPDVIENRRAVDEKKTLETLSALPLFCMASSTEHSFVDRIKAHGGSYCQKPQPKERSSVLRVYGGPDQIPRGFRTYSARNVLRFASRCLAHSYSDILQLPGLSPLSWSRTLQTS